MTDTLLNRTLAMLAETDATDAEICAGADLKRGWLAKLRGGSGGMTDPGVNKIERLHDFLATWKRRRARNRVA